MHRGEERQQGHDEDWVKTENRKKAANDESKRREHRENSSKPRKKALLLLSTGDFKFVFTDWILVQQ